ncbi:hypothetical protein ACH47Z_35980 [Streptomyces sp. NPDC020192]|uniref:hypothetical protein n=1 Tax=Streptomyces sp. NPDC020192 TaxID=3365066 RepID=UPI0037B886EB
MCRADIAVDIDSRTICAAILRPADTKAVDAALLLERVSLACPDRPGVVSEAIRIPNVIGGFLLVGHDLRLVAGEFGRSSARVMFVEVADAVGARPAGGPGEEGPRGGGPAARGGANVHIALESVRKPGNLPFLPSVGIGFATASVAEGDAERAVAIVEGSAELPCRQGHEGPDAARLRADVQAALGPQRYVRAVKQRRRLSAIEFIELLTRR